MEDSIEKFLDRSIYMAISLSRKKDREKHQEKYMDNVHFFSTTISTTFGKETSFLTELVGA